MKNQEENEIMKNTERRDQQMPYISDEEVMNQQKP